MLPKRPEATLDIECYRNYFLVKFRDLQTMQFHEYSMFPGKELDVLAIMDLVRKYTLFTFNGNHYDIPMLTMALTGLDTYAMKQVNDTIIRGRMKAWDVYRSYRQWPPDELDHVDLMEVAPGVKLGLKAYAGRQHSRKMQDLPIDPDDYISPMQRVELSAYCGNDHECTSDLKREIQGRLDLRRVISDQYGVDVRSKSDAQISEALIKRKVGYDVYPQQYRDGHTFRYAAPGAVSFITPELQNALRVIQQATFTFRDADQIRNLKLAGYDEVVGDWVSETQELLIKSGVKMSPKVKNLLINIAGNTYKMGIGGLHSQEQKRMAFTIPGVKTVSDHDVSSYYPSLILAMNMYPKGIGEVFISIYREIYERRLYCKREADRLKDLLKTATSLDATVRKELEKAQKAYKTEADSLKIVLNGAFGKLGSKYSVLFAPELLIQTTVTGQLYLLMLIERLSLAGIKVISANTDGIVVETPWGMEDMRDTIIAQWERDTQLITEATFYSAIYLRDVNNYVAFKMDGEHKGKGVFARSGVVSPDSPGGKHPTLDVCMDAAIEFLKHGTPVYQSIRACNDPRKFLTIRNVRGGGLYDDKYLGKTVRWYYGMDASKSIRYKTSGNKVATSDGAIPMMELVDTLPADVDYARYAQVANDMLRDLGLPV